MRLNHLDLQVTDVQAHIAFLERFFAMHCVSNRDSPTIAFMKDAHGFSLVLQRKEAPHYPEDFHIGFLVPTEADLESLHAQLKHHAIHTSDIKRSNRGTLLYCKAPDGWLIEVSVG